MTDMGDTWRDKDDLDLTSEDISAMLDEGTPVEVRGPVRVPAGGRLVSATLTYWTGSTTAPERSSAGLQLTHR